MFGAPRRCQIFCLLFISCDCRLINVTFLSVNEIKMIGMLPSSPGKLTRTYNKEVRWLIMHLNFSFNLLKQPVKYCAGNYLRGWS